MQRKPPGAPLSILESRILEAEAAVDAAFERVAAADARLAALVELLEDQGDHEPEIREAGDGEADIVFDDPALAGLSPSLWNRVVRGLEDLRQAPEGAQQAEVALRACNLPEPHVSPFIEHAARTLGVPVEWLASRN